MCEEEPQLLMFACSVGQGCDHWRGRLAGGDDGRGGTGCMIILGLRFALDQFLARSWSRDGARPTGPQQPAAPLTPART